MCYPCDRGIVLPICPGYTKRPRMPWFLIIVLLGSTTINYIDRIAISVLAPTLRDEFSMSNSDYAWVINCFQVGYLVCYSIGGRLGDVWGARLALSIYVVWWSIAGMMHSMATGALSLGLFRFLLSVGEGGTWPVVMKAVAQYTPGPMRSLAIGIVNNGSAFGAVVAPPLVAWLTLRWGWQTAFLATGSLGLIWLPFWLKASKRPIPPPDADATDKGLTWLQLLRYRQNWAMFLCRLIGDPFYGFFLFWLPEYLTRDRGLELSEMAWVTAIPFVAADVGNLLGGGLTSWLINRGWTLHRARRVVMVTFAAGTMTAMAAPFADSIEAAITIMAFACMCYMTWSVNTVAMPSDYFSPPNQSTVMGLSGTGSGLGMFLINTIVGRVLDRTGSYKAVLIGISFLVPVSQAVLTWVGGPIRRVDGEGPRP